MYWPHLCWWQKVSKYVTNNTLWNRFWSIRKCVIYGILTRFRTLFVSLVWFMFSLRLTNCFYLFPFLNKLYFLNCFLLLNISLSKFYYARDPRTARFWFGGSPFLFLPWYFSVFQSILFYGKVLLSLQNIIIIFLNDQDCFYLASFDIVFILSPLTVPNKENKNQKNCWTSSKASQYCHSW